MGNAADGVDVAEDKVAAKFFAGGERLLKIYARALLQAEASAPNEVLLTVSPDKSAESRPL